MGSRRWHSSMNEIVPNFREKILDVESGIKQMIADGTIRINYG
jgi:hypothetical protein